ncbi:hypothetical protein IAU60_000412 [Kwoniella sp. DSM 27419]
MEYLMDPNIVTNRTVTDGDTAYSLHCPEDYISFQIAITRPVDDKSTTLSNALEPICCDLPTAEDLRRQLYSQVPANGLSDGSSVHLNPKWSAKLSTVHLPEAVMGQLNDWQRTSVPTYGTSACYLLKEVEVSQKPAEEGRKFVKSVWDFQRQIGVVKSVSLRYSYRSTPLSRS